MNAYEELINCLLDMTPEQLRQFMEHPTTQQIMAESGKGGAR